MHFPKSWVSTWTVRMQFVTIRARGGAPRITLTGSRLLQTAPRAAQSPPIVPTSLSNSLVMSTEALVIIPNTPVHQRSRFASRSGQKRPIRPYRGSPEAPEGSHGPPEVPIHLVPPLGGLLSTRGGHGKGLQPCFTIREDLTDRARPPPTCWGGVAGPPPTSNYMLGGGGQRGWLSW